MEGFIVKLGTMSVQAALIILVVCVIRMLFMKGRISQKYIMLLWMIPFFFMVFPWKISSPIGFWRAETVAVQEQEKVQTQSSVLEAIREERYPDRQYEILEIAKTEQEGIAFIEDVAVKNSYSTYDILIAGLFGAWLLGAAVVLCYVLLSTLKLKKQLVCSVCEEDNIYLAEDIFVPMVFGVVRPRIYLPVHMDEEHRSYVLAHEQTHIMRRDPFKKLVAFLIVGVHWFNPFAWLAFMLLERDIEMSCDEETVKRLGEEEKKAYAGTLLWISTGRDARGYKLGVPLAFGEVDTKQRIKNILMNKKTMQFVAVVVILVCVVLTAVFMTKREENMADARLEESMEVVETPVPLTALEQIEIVKAVVTEDMIGAPDGMELVYVDDVRLICRDYNALYIYDLKNYQMLQQVALEPIGCQYTQGDNYCEIYALADGSKVYLHPQMTNDMYLYDVQEDTLWKQSYDFKNISLWDLAKSWEEVSFYDGLLSRNDYIEHDYTSYQSAYCAKLGENTYGYLTTGSGMLMDTAWVQREPGKLESSCYLFRENEDRPHQEEQATLETREFTMDMLIAISNGRNYTDAFRGVAEEGSLCYDNFSRSESEHSLTWSYFWETEYQGKDYRMQVSYWKPETAAEYGEAANALDSIYLMEMLSGDMILLYRAEKGYSIGKTELMEFLGRQYDIEDYMTLELPKGITLGNYQVEINNTFNGCLMYGEDSKTVHGEWCPEAWYALGGVGVMEKNIYEPMLTFKDGRLSEVWWPMNHGGVVGDGEFLEGCDMQAILYEAEFDVFTIPEWEEYKAKYPDAPEEWNWSKYWYVFFGEPDGEMVYTVYLNQENFTKEDVIALARSVRFVKR